MLKNICVCDRCGKEFEAELAKRVVFEPALSSKRASRPKIIEMIAEALKNPPQDFCPECVEKIKKFMNSKEDRPDKEAAADEPG